MNTMGTVLFVLASPRTETFCDLLGSLLNKSPNGYGCSAVELEEML